MAAKRGFAPEGNVPLETQYGVSQPAKTSENTGGAAAGTIESRPKTTPEVARGGKVKIEKGEWATGKEKMLTTDIAPLYKKLDKKYEKMDLDEMGLQLALRRDESEELSRVYDKAVSDLKNVVKAAEAGDHTIAAILKQQREEYEEGIAQAKKEAEAAEFEVRYLEGLVAAKEKIEKAA